MILTFANNSLLTNITFIARLFELLRPRPRLFGILPSFHRFFACQSVVIRGGCFFLSKALISGLVYRLRGDNEMKTVTILLTKYSGVVSTLVYYLCSRGYTHASISLDGGEVYYIFNYHGFCKETLDKHRYRGVKRASFINFGFRTWLLMEWRATLNPFRSIAQNLAIPAQAFFFVCWVFRFNGKSTISALNLLSSC